MDTGRVVEQALLQSWRQYACSLPSGRTWERDGILVAASGIDAPHLNPGLVAAAPVAPADAVEWGVRVRKDNGLPGGGFDLPAGRYPAVEAAIAGLGHHVKTARPMMAIAVDEIVNKAPATDVRIVTEPADLEAFYDIQARGFDLDREVARASVSAPVLALPGLFALVAYVDAEPAACAIGQTVAGTAGVFGVATVPEHRGRGLARAVTVAAIDACARAGATLAWLQASDMGVPVYRSMGFRPVDQWVVWTGADG